MDRVIGYIVVVDEHGVGELTKEPLVEGDEQWPKSGLILSGTTATLFPSNYRAKEAIKRTVNYARATDRKQWPGYEDYSIVPVVRVV